MTTITGYHSLDPFLSSQCEHPPVPDFDRPWRLLTSTHDIHTHVSPIEFVRLHCGSTTNVVRRSKRCGCQRELLIAPVFSRTPALLPLPPTASSATGMSPSCVRRSPRSGPSASTLSNRSHVSSGGRLINCLAEAELLCHLTLMHLPSISFSTTRLPVFGQLLRALMNLGSLQPRSGVSSVSLLHRLRSSRWCLLCLTSSACLTVCRRGYSRRASTCLRRSCAGCSVGPSNTALFRRV